MIQPSFKRCTGALLLALAIASTAANAAADTSAPGTDAAKTGASQEITEAEKIIFLDNHFAHSDKKKIDYTYRKTGAPPDGFNDSVTVDVLQRHPDGTASVSMQFLSGERKISIPAMEQAQGNPAILGFLERDISEMKRLTGGSTAYFRQRIRLALASPNVTIKKINVTYDNRPIVANEIAVYPYLDDPMKQKIGKYTGKGYVFILSKDVPGSLYRIYTTETSKKNASPVIETSLTIAQAGTAK